MIQVSGLHAGSQKLGSLVSRAGLSEASWTLRSLITREDESEVVGARCSSLRPTQGGSRQLGPCLSSPDPLTASHPSLQPGAPGAN